MIHVGATADASWHVCWGIETEHAVANATVWLEGPMGRLWSHLLLEYAAKRAYGKRQCGLPAPSGDHGARLGSHSSAIGRILEA